MNKETFTLEEIEVAIEVAIEKINGLWKIAHTAQKVKGEITEEIQENLDVTWKTTQKLMRITGENIVTILKSSRGIEDDDV